jgi:GDP-L-fucose synthase
MRAIVTGSTGFMGKSLCRHLEAKGLSITELSSKNCDLRKAESLDKFSGEDYDYVVHLAAWTQAGDFCLKHAGEQWIINQQMNTNVLDWWSCRQPKAKLIIIGTSCAYAPESGLSESEYMQGEPIDSLYTYAMTKRMLYQGALALHKQFGLSYLCVVPSTLYGSDYHTDGRQMHFIFDLIRKIIRGKEFGESVILWGDGYQRRELVLVDDFVEIMWKLVQIRDNDIFNIGSGVEHTIREFASVICRHVGYDERLITYDTSRYVGAKSKCLNVEKIKQVISPYKLESLDVGIGATVKWFYESRAYEALGPI